LILAMISVLMAEESIRRLLRPEAIQFNEAIGIAAIGLAVNLLSAWLLEAGDHGHAHEAEEGHDHPHEHHHDHNLRSAYLHVLADALTSVLAIVALGFGKFYGLGWMDPVMGIVGSLVILRWAYGLCRDTGYELLDVHSKQVPPEEIRRVLQPHGIETLDIHTWRIAPNAIAGELVVETAALRGADYYRELLRGQVEVHHLIIEERLLIGK
jgi:cation diffusion facilitator family transporter